MGITARNASLQEKHDRLERIVDRTTKLLDESGSVGEPLNDSATYRDLAIIMACAVTTKDELDEPRMPDADEVIMNVGNLRSWISQILESAKELGDPDFPVPEKLDLLEYLSELAYEVDEDLSREIDKAREEVRELGNVTRKRDEQREETEPEEEIIDVPPEDIIEEPSDDDILTRAKELYAISDQGEWSELAPVLQQHWIEAAHNDIGGTV